jgi:hypothetical protein
VGERTRFWGSPFWLDLHYCAHEDPGEIGDIKSNVAKLGFVSVPQLFEGFTALEKGVWQVSRDAKHPRKTFELGSRLGIPHFFNAPASLPVPRQFQEQEGTSDRARRQRPKAPLSAPHRLAPLGAPESLSKRLVRRQETGGVMEYLFGV